MITVATLFNVGIAPAVEPDPQFIGSDQLPPETPV